MLLALDAAFPPSPDQWVRDLQSVGADVGFVYVWGPFVNYTKAHVDAAQAAGIHVVPIIVPGNSPPAPPLYAAAEPYGITSGLIAYDIEDGSLPGADWVRQAVDQSNAAGWSAGVYCDQQKREFYSAGWWWLALWPLVGTINPIPGGLPAETVAWQYTHDVNINGSQYDVSIVDPALFGGSVGGDQDMNQEEHDWLFGLNRQVGDGYTPTGVAGTILSRLDTIETKLSTSPPVDAGLQARIDAAVSALTAVVAALKGGTG